MKHRPFSDSSKIRSGYVQIAEYLKTFLDGKNLAAN